MNEELKLRPRDLPPGAASRDHEILDPQRPPRQRIPPGASDELADCVSSTSQLTHPSPLPPANFITPPPLKVGIYIHDRTCEIIDGKAEAGWLTPGWTLGGWKRGPVVEGRSMPSLMAR